jgi:hypothetical protein
MRKLFLIVGIACTVAAFAIFLRKTGENPFSRRGPQRAFKSADQRVSRISFSPNGNHLVFVVYDEAGDFHETDTYLYSLGRKTITRLNTNKDGYITGPLCWAADSIRVGYNEERPGVGSFYSGRVLNVETNSVEEKFSIFFLGWSPDGDKQLFHNLYTNEVFVKEVGKPTWSVLPKRLGEGKDVYCWSGDSRSFVYSDTMHDIQEYRLEENVVRNVGLLGEYSIRGFFHPSLSTNSVYFLTDREPKGSGRGVVVWKTDLRAGETVKFFDSGLDPEGELISQMFFGPGDSPIYLVLYKKDTRALVRLDPLTKKTETVFTGQFAAWDYSSKRDLVAITLEEDKHRTLHLFNVKTGQIERIFPAR